jgi:hypothetical protein
MNSDLPPSEVKLDRLKQEAFSVLGAGTETTAWTLSVTTYYILANPAIHNRMKEELRPVFQKAGGRPSWTQLEQLPYLQGVISEGLRLSFGVSAHLPRVAPDEVLCYQNWKIPAGVTLPLPLLIFIPLSPSQRVFLSRQFADSLPDTNWHDVRPPPPRPRHLPLAPNLPPLALARESPALAIPGVVLEGIAKVLGDELGVCGAVFVFVLYRAFFSLLDETLNDEGWVVVIADTDVHVDYGVSGHEAF